MATVYNFLNPDSTEVEEQRIISAPGATTGDVLTVAANGTVAPAPGGGSQPGALVWALGKSFTFAEWNAGLADVTTLATGTLLYDAFVLASPDFDDSYDQADLKLGWGLGGATPRAFGGPASTHLPIYGGIVSTGEDRLPAGVSGGLTPGGVAVTSQSVMAGMAGDQGAYGAPVYIKDSAVAGPLQMSPNGNGDATAGSVAIWLLTATLA